MKDRFQKTSSILGTVFYSVIFFVPLILVLSNFSIPSFLEVLGSQYNRKVLLFTLCQAFLSSLLSIIIGFPGAFILSNRNLKFQRIIKKIYFIPFVLPSILLVLGFVIFYGNTGILNNILYKLFSIRVKFLYSFKTILAAHVFFNFPIAVYLIGNAWEKINPETLSAAKSDGANSFTIFRKIILPFLGPSIASAFSLIFLYCLTSFAIILVLGGGPRFTTTEVEIYRQATLSLNIEKATSLSVFSLAFALIALLINSHFEKRVINDFKYSNMRKTNPGIIEKVYLIVSILFICCPLISIVIKGFTQKAYIEVINNIDCLVNTVIIGLASATVGTAIAISICKCKSNLIHTFGMLPMATSSVVIGLSYIIVGRYLKGIPDIVLVILAHSAIVTPFAIKTLLPGIRGLEKNLSETAQTDGASQFNIFCRIELPQLMNCIKTSFLFSFAISCGELNSTILLGGRIKTIPVLIYRMVSSYNYEGACAFGTILILLCVLISKS